MIPIKAVIASNRFGLGARPGELARHADQQAWLLDQLQGPSRTPQELTDLPDTASQLVRVQDLRRERRAARKAAQDNTKAYARFVREAYIEQTAARYRHAASTDLPFHERLVHFWTNHFAVSADKQPLPAIAGLMENEAIRPNVSNKFVDLLMSVEKHPAMIVYLDNQRSIGPNSTLGKRANRRRSDQELSLIHI